MLKPFLNVCSPDEARTKLLEFGPYTHSKVSLDAALYHVVADPVYASDDGPLFNRSTMDGFAVRSRDTFGTSESSPGLFDVIGEIRMGEISEIELKKGQAARIWTGGALPKGSDAVVMLEYAEELGNNTVELLKAAAPYDNVIRRGEDFQAGEILLEIGHRIRPQDIGFLAALGTTEVSVFKKPVIALISSGDEIVPVTEDPKPGCVRDVNRHTLVALIRENYGVPLWIGIAKDTPQSLTEMINKGLEQADVVVVSGGSSMGSRDYVIETICALKDSRLLLHGVSVSPGKPLILARVGPKAVVGLPGHPVSAMVCFEQFVVPLLRRLEGEDTVMPFLRPTLKARLSRNLPSREGRMDFVRVRLENTGGVPSATPIFGKSGVISAMVKAHGFVRIDPDCEGLYKGDEVVVVLYSNWCGDNCEKEYLSGYEAPGRGSTPVFGPAEHELLSRT